MRLRGARISAVAIALAGVMALTTGGAASAHNYDTYFTHVSAPGSLFATHTVIIKTTSKTTYVTNIWRAESKYTVGMQAGNMCKRYHQFRYVLPRESVKRTKLTGPEGCGPMLVNSIDYDYWYAGGVSTGSSFCTRSKNSLSGNEWSEWACVTATHSH